MPETEPSIDAAAEADPLPAPPNGIRTFTPRWRNSPLTDERMARLMPARALPDGPLVPEVAFGRTSPVVVEIGSGHGAAAIAFCAA
ncbi:MAG TPA: hypothetical protein PKK62_12525, partial [Ornithinibacter sp.]|nr:hypothetical protein [Ornithinibacter sp.]